ncbi:MAG: histidine kinase [Saprospiraceae bacterium]
MLIFLTSAAGAQHPLWRNFTINDGLPSNEVYSLMQDRRGLLWITTNQGVCYFNGYEFSRPVDTSTSVVSSTFNLCEDARGRVWFSRLPASLWLVEKDTVRPWQYNSTLAAYQKNIGYTGHFLPVGEDSVWVEIGGKGILQVGRGGSSRFVQSLNKAGISIARIGGALLEVVEADPGAEMTDGLTSTQGQTEALYYWENGQAVPLGRFPLKNAGKGVPFRAWGLRNGDLILCCQQTFYLVHDKRLVWYGQKDVYVEQIVEDTDGAILLCSVAEGTSGLLRYASQDHFKRDEFVNLLPGHAVMRILRDREGGWWAGTSDAGIFYCKNPKLDIYDASSGLPSDNVQRLASDGRYTYAGLRPFDIYAIPMAGGAPLRLPWPPGTDFKELTDLQFDTLTGRLWCGADLCFWENNRWTFSGKSFDLTDHPINSIPAQNITPDPGVPAWWVDYRYKFALIDRHSGTARSYHEVRERIFALAPNPDGTIWMATLNGLRLWRGGLLEPPPFQHPALRFQPRDVERLPAVAGGGIAVALRGGGILICDAQGRFTHLDAGHGLSSNSISRLRVTSDGVIFGCSSTGLNRLSRQPDGSWHIETLTVKHGLPSNQVNDVVLSGNEIWVATDRGVAHFKSGMPAAEMYPPALESLLVNNRATPFSPGMQLDHDHNNLNIRFLALYLRSGGDILYRYRLLGADTAYSFARSREVGYAALRPGDYVFEVQAQNEDGQWGPAARWAFSIQPAWWNTIWFRTLLVCLFCVGAWLLFRARLRIIRKETEIRERMRDLQSAALRAQMNPHFIFNCLNSIQSFIAENDAASATRYLARFARLVRLALHASIEGRHSLADEVDMLDHYLALEQLRFHGKFRYEIVTAENLDKEWTTLPPLLVQPFVENAILHGMKTREKDGLIQVRFTTDDQDMVVTVTDNGPGFVSSNAENRSQEAHKSVGQQLTRNRLTLLAGHDQAPRLQQETIFDDQGNPLGAKVIIRVPMENKN